MPESLSAQSAFETARHIANPTDRATYLNSACGDNVALRRRVERLLKAHESAGSFLEKPVPIDESATRDDSTHGVDTSAIGNEHVGSQIGPYKLIKILGEGGMGSVWAAEQGHPVKRLVALKLIKLGLDTRGILARFEAERQALAMMNHSNIAKVFDAGATVGGRPFFVMEFVDGIPITTYCDQQRLSPRGRLELFIPVCQAVQHAHQKGIIHRDLKPSNILVGEVDGRPEPKVIDFGVAKATSHPLTEQSLHTEAGAIVGTPEYMAPEQAEIDNQDIDTRADIYALGVILYELLAGRPPFSRKEMQKAGLLEILRLVREVDPPKPSTRLSTADDLPSLAAVRRLEPRRLTNTLRGDLDWIVMKALEKDRTRRYETANGLALDIQRYLADEPVSAGPPNPAYRLKKFVRRNKGPVLATTLLALALIGGIVGTSWQAIRAERARSEEVKQRGFAEANEKKAQGERDRALTARKRTRDALDAMVSHVTGQSLTTQEALSPEQSAFLANVLTYYQEFASEPGDDLEGQIRLAYAHFELGRMRSLLGHKEEAVRVLAIAAKMYDQLATTNSENPFFSKTLAKVLNNRSKALRELGLWSESEKDQRSALTIQNRLVTLYPRAVDNQLELSRSYSNFGLLLKTAGRRTEAESAFRAAIKIQEMLVSEFPDDSFLRKALGHSFNNLGQLFVDYSKLTQAEECHRTALAVRERLIEELPQETNLKCDLASSLLNLANVLTKRGKSADAESIYRKALAIVEKSAVEYRLMPEFRFLAGLCLYNYATLMFELGRWQQAEETFRSAISIQSNLVTDFPRSHDFRHELAKTHGELGGLLNYLKRIPDAETAQRTALSIREQLIKETPYIPDYRNSLGFSHRGLARIYSDSNRKKEALTELQAALAIWEKLSSEFPNVASYRNNIASAHNEIGIVLSENGDQAGSEAAHLKSLTIKEALVAEFPDMIDFRLELAGGYCNFGNIYEKNPECLPALTYYNKAISILETTVAQDKKGIVQQQYRRNSYVGRAVTLDKLGRYAESVADWDKAIALEDPARSAAIRIRRAFALVRIGEAKRGLIDVDELTAAQNATARILYDGACIYSLASATLPDDSERLAALGVETLKRAFEKGFKNVAHMKKDKDLDALRGRNDYQAFIRSLETQPPN